MNNTSATRPTLAELNTSPRTRTWSTYVLESFRAVGQVGHMRTGTKRHLLSCERVIGYVGDWKPARNQYKIGDTFSAHASCNGNGQNIARPINGLDTSDITCEKCS